MYADRPRETWARETHGLLEVATNPLDPNAFLRTHLARPVIHHVAVNTWGAAGAGPRAAALGLGQVNIDLPADDDVAALPQRLADHRVDVRHDGAVLRFDDPWGTLIQVGVDAHR